MSAASPTGVRLERRGSVAIVEICNPPVNALSTPVRAALMAALQELAGDPALSGLVIWGGEGHFIAGADINEMDTPPVPPHLPDIIAVLESLSVPIVAAMDGPGLGGGYEIALASDYRLASPKARVGLPETQIGVIPGAGGCIRLPRLVGVSCAIDLIGNGRILDAGSACEAGLIDEITKHALLDAAIRKAGRIGKRRLLERPVPAETADRIEAAAVRIVARTRGAEAPAEAIAVLRAAASLPIAEALRLERETFLRLRQGPECAARRHLFRATRRAAGWRTPGGAAPRPVERVAVIGGGAMGAAIAYSFSMAGLAVDIIERNADAAGAAQERLAGLMDETRRTGTGPSVPSLLPATVRSDWSSAPQADLIIEAVFEDLNAKLEVFRRMEQHARAGAILATNTSYLDIDRLADATDRPGDVVGLHFFAPAHRMKLIEIVRTDRTRPDVLTTGFALARRLGKAPVLARTGEGFIGNRIYAAYRRHMEYMVEDGATPAQIDRALEAYGFAMGPFAVSDLSGLDIAYAMRQRRRSDAGTRAPSQRYVELPDLLCESGRIGRKSGAGWYDYEEGLKRESAQVEALVARERQRKGIVPRAFSSSQIVSRALAVIVNEACHVLDEGVAGCAGDIDVVLTNGYGFPAHRGGPMFAADQIGPASLVAELDGLGSTSVTISALLMRAAASGARLAGLEGRADQASEPVHADPI